MATLQQLTALVEELTARIDRLEAIKGRDRGPKSEGEMTEEDAVRCMLGDLRDLSHKAAALKLGLSYGQVYSARKGYTFKSIYQKQIRGEFIDVPTEQTDQT